MSKLVLMLLGCSLVSITWAQPTLNPKFEQKIENLIQHSVPTITCERLNEKMSIPNLVLLDAREKKEFQTSHLKNAVWVGYKTFDKKQVAAVPKDAIVVVYCSVGYRSEKIGEQLKALGYNRVYNLYGGVFEWANRAYLLLNEQEQPTQSVHAYNKNWGRWLERGQKVY